MAVTNYQQAKPETQLGFLIGYLSGSLACNAVAGKGRAALVCWSRHRSREIDRLFAEFDKTLVEDHAPADQKTIKN
jgi:hypothetical protein